MRPVHANFSTVYDGLAYSGGGLVMNVKTRKVTKIDVSRNPVHPFPARMAPSIALRVLSSEKRPIRILDPMMGSGTVPAVARAMGHRAFGTDIDPLAVLLSKVWSRTIDPDLVRDRANHVLSKAKRISRSIKISDAYPPRCDKNTKKFIRYWFDPYSRRQLAALATAIRTCTDDAVKDVLWCAFSRLIITKRVRGITCKGPGEQVGPVGASVYAWIVPHIGAIAAMSAEIDVIDVWRIASFEDQDEFVLRPVERAHPTHGLVPDHKVFELAVDGSPSSVDLRQMPPVHKDVVQRAID